MRRGQVKEIPAYRFIIAATITFIVGLFVFTIIFRAWLTFKELQQTVIESGNLDENQATLAILGAIPWALGGIYISLLGTIIYFLIRGSKPPRTSSPPPSNFRKY